ncbi:hypothetical protein [Flavobacterium sp. WC2430]|uniref:hypothetical protein n=1 Tax=Flavobacterium sp. WC2430 TaxID=3234137 RepID=UPI003466F51C
MSYKVLLIDDQHNGQPLEQIKKMAKMANIELVGEKYHVQGMELLKNDSSYEYQAVILDATGYKKSDIDEEKQSNTGLFYSLKFLSELLGDRIIPWFIYTGAQRNLTNQEFMEPILEYQNNIKFGRIEFDYYTKTLHEKELIQDIIKEIDNLEQTKIEIQHRQVFQIAKKINVPSEDINHLVTIIKSIQSNGSDLEPSLYFTQLRKYVEYVFRDAVKYNILHENCIGKDGKLNLTDSSLFLAGEPTKHCKPNNVRCSKTHFSKLMADNIKNLLFITGAASHTSDVDPAKNMDYQDYRAQIKTPYLLYQLTFTVCDLLVWYQNYLIANSNMEANESLCIDLVENNNNQNASDWHEGHVTKIAENGFGTFQPNNGSNSLSIHPIAVTNNQITLGDNLNVRTEPSPDGTKLHIKEIIKL